MTRVGLWTLAMALCVPTSLGAAQDVPPGHPPTGTQPAPSQPAAPPTPAPGVPAGHPPTPGQPPVPAGHPPTSGQAPGVPAGHPPTPGQAAPPGLPAGHPSTMPGQPSPGPTQMSGRLPRVLQTPSLATAEESDDVPAGSIRVTVVDGDGQPVVDAPVDVGVLAQGDRSRHNSRTNDEGVAHFADLPTGDGQAYRVNVPHGGAKYSSAPFQLPPDRGYDVRITRLPVTHETRYVFFHVFRVIVEQRGERMHVIHQTELTNAGEETFVFPAQGQRVALPEGATNFQFQRVMTDQRVEEDEGDDGAPGYVLRGSVPPGTIRLAYAYDIELEGGDLEIPVELPLPFFGLQVLAEALPELDLSVRGMPRPQRLSQEGEPCENSLRTPNCAWVTQLRHGPEDSRLERVVLELRGIPGPSPARWIAVGLAVFLTLLGVVLAFLRRGGGDTAGSRQRRRDALVDEARLLDEELAAGEIGPGFHRKRRDEIVRELAVLLHRDEQGEVRGPASASHFVAYLLLSLVVGALPVLIFAYVTRARLEMKVGAAVALAIYVAVGAGIALVVLLSS